MTPPPLVPWSSSSLVVLVPRHSLNARVRPDPIDWRCLDSPDVVAARRRHLRLLVQQGRLNKQQAAPGANRNGLYHQRSQAGDLRGCGLKSDRR